MSSILSIEPAMPFERHLPRYAVELVAALAAYTVLLVGSLLALRGIAVDSPWRTAVSLSPMLGGIAVLVVVVRALRAMDELQRRIQLEALGFAFAGTALLSFSYGFLENVGFPPRTMFWVWPVMAALWALGVGVATRRYL